MKNVVAEAVDAVPVAQDVEIEELTVQVDAESPVCFVQHVVPSKQVVSCHSQSVVLKCDAEISRFGPPDESKKSLVPHVR